MPPPPHTHIHTTTPPPTPPTHLHTHRHTRARAHTHTHTHTHIPYWTLSPPSLPLPYGRVPRCVMPWQPFSRMASGQTHSSSNVTETSSLWGCLKIGKSFMAQTLMKCVRQGVLLPCVSCVVGHIVSCATPHCVAVLFRKHFLHQPVSCICTEPAACS